MSPKPKNAFEEFRDRVKVSAPTTSKKAKPKKANLVMDSAGRWVVPLAPRASGSPIIVNREQYLKDMEKRRCMKLTSI